MAATDVISEGLDKLAITTVLDKDAREIVDVAKPARKEPTAERKSKEKADGKLDHWWPVFKNPKSDPILGKKEMTPEQTLVEFISCSASFHGVRKQSLKSLEWDLLKVFPNNVMPANSAAWYMAKRKFYSTQPLEQQLLPFILKKYPDKFRVSKYRVDFLESYSKETARRKMLYLVQYGLNAYFSHKVDEYGVYFFDPLYYERTEPFHESLRVCSRESGSKGRLIASYFGAHKDQFVFKSHANNLVSVCNQPGVKVITNTTGVIISMVNNQYGYIKFGAGETALFCAKAVYRDGWQYTGGDFLRLPAMQFDAYQVPSNVSGAGGDETCKWYAVLVWYGQKPAPRYCSSVADLNSTPVFRNGNNLNHLKQGEGGRKLRQPSGSMMIGQIISVRKNGAVVSVRDDSDEKVFIPGWCKEVDGRPGLFLTTLTGDCVGMRDLVAYYHDSHTTVPGFSIVGKDVMVLKEHQETEPTKKRRSRRSVSLSAGAEYEQSGDDLNSSSAASSELEVSDSELEWLENDISEIMVTQGPEASTHYLLEKSLAVLNSTRRAVQNNTKRTKGRNGSGSGRDSGLESKETTPVPPKTRNFSPQKGGKAFWRTKAALASLHEYRSSEDEDYKSGEDVESLAPTVRGESRGRTRRRTRRKSSGMKRGISATDKSSVNGLDDSFGSSAASLVFTRRTRNGRSASNSRYLPYWVRAVSLPEEFDLESGKFVPVDRWYKEERDPDYTLPVNDTDEDEKEAEEEEKEKVAKVAEVEDEPKDEKDGENNETAEETSEKEKPAVENDLDDDFVAALLKEAREPLSEDLLQGAHRKGRKGSSSHSTPTPKVTVTPTKKGEDGDEEEEDIVIVEASGEDLEFFADSGLEEKSSGEKGQEEGRERREEGKEGREGQMSEFARWVARTLAKAGEDGHELPEDEEDDYDSEEDPEYVPPAVIFESDLDYDEYDIEELEEGEVAALEGERESELYRAGNYIPIWVPVTSVQVRNELAKEFAENKKKEDEARAANREALANQDDVGSGLTPAFRSMKIREDTPLSKARTAGRTRVGSDQSTSEKAAVSPTKKAASPRKSDGGGGGDDEVGGKKAANSSPKRGGGTSPSPRKVKPSKKSESEA